VWKECETAKGKKGSFFKFVGVGGLANPSTRGLAKFGYRAER